MRGKGERWRWWWCKRVRGGRWLLWYIQVGVGGGGAKEGDKSSGDERWRNVVV